MDTALKRVGWGLLLLGAALMFLYAAVIYLQFDLDLAPKELQESFKARPWVIYIHIFGAMVALIIGPFQFLTRLRDRYVNIHRWMGRIYLTGALFGGLGGFYVALYAFGEFSTRLGFASLAIIWLFTSFMAYKRIRAKNVQVHREWMIRSYALAFAAVTFRIWLGVFMSTGMSSSKRHTRRRSGLHACLI